MRKRSKYRPRGVRLDTMAYVKEGLTPIAALGDANVILRARNHGALKAMVDGQGTKAVASDLVGSINVAEALMGMGLGKDWQVEIHAGHAAIKAMCRRGHDRGRFLFTGEELTAVNLAMAVHDAQLDAATIKDLERAIEIVNVTVANGHAEKIVEAM
jgi:hypothetical protein